MNIIIKSPQAMQKIAAKIALNCHGGCKIYLQGELGVGKTTFVRGLLQQLGWDGTVRSPTFTLLEPYNINSHTIYHFDLYRINDPEELELIGLRDYFTVDSVCIVEWPERAAKLLPQPDLVVKFAFGKNSKWRELDLVAMTAVGKALIQQKHARGRA